MKIHCVITHLSDDEYAVIQKAADIEERLTKTPRNRGSMREFIASAAVDRATKIVDKKAASE